MAARKKAEVTEAFSFGPWSITAKKGPIITTAECERLENELEIPSLPEMLFGDTFLQILHEVGGGVAFNAIDALRLVDNKNDLIKVACAEEWRKQREDCPETIKEVIKPFDWTFSTNYKGTLVGNNPFKVEDTLEKIDLEKLKQREKIHFYQDLLLFEDELADNGTSTLSVKLRVMPSSFFLLLRFFLRVDDVLVRTNDTRMFHQADSDYILREYTSKEKKVKDLANPHADINVLSEQLDVTQESSHKLLINIPDVVSEDR